jgi:hypothetical protein
MAGTGRGKTITLLVSDFDGYVPLSWSGRVPDPLIEALIFLKKSALGERHSCGSLAWRGDRPGTVSVDGAPATPERQAGPFPQDQLPGRPSLPGLAWQKIRRAPATMCYLAAVWAAGLATGSIAHGPPRWLSGHVGADLPSLGHGYWWTPLSAGLWASGLGGYLAV